MARVKSTKKITTTEEVGVKMSDQRTEKKGIMRISLTSDFLDDGTILNLRGVNE